MNYTEHKITLDIHQTASAVSLRVKKGDTARRLLIHLAERGKPYHIEADCYAVFTAAKPDGKVIFNNCRIDDCEIIYDFTEQTVAAVGLMPCEIILYGENGKQLTSASFTMQVEDTVYDTEKEVESTSEFNALADLIAKAQSVIGNGGGAAGSAVRIGQATIRAAAWVGDAAPYSQVVAIDGITEYSQVDLNPSVEQLAIFHEKDLAFVTENDGGIVTVYAIGDKPQNDYTMQVTITEVNV